LLAINLSVAFVGSEVKAKVFISSIDNQPESSVAFVNLILTSSDELNVLNQVVETKSPVDVNVPEGISIDGNITSAKEP
jgi:hypothetical protein